MIRVFIAARSRVTQAGLAALVSHPEIVVVGMTAQLEELDQSVAAEAIDVVLLDVTLIDTAPSAFWLGWGNTAIAVLVEPSDANGVADWLRAGVRGILPTDASATDLTLAIQAIATGLVVLHPAIADPLFHDLPDATSTATPMGEPLTPREIEVLQMLATGMGNKAIAQHLMISEHTVKFHISSIFSKLNAANRTEAVTIAMRQGLVFV